MPPRPTAPTFAGAVVRLGNSPELRSWWALADTERRQVGLTPAEGMYAVYTAGGRSPEDAVEQVLVDFRFGDSEVDVDSVCRAQEWMVPIYAKKAANLESNSKILRFRSWILEHERLVGEVASQIWTARQAERELLLLLRQARSRVLSHGIAGNKTATEAMLSAIKELNRIHRIGERSERDSMENTLKVIFMGEGDLE